MCLFFTDCVVGIYDLVPNLIPRSLIIFYNLSWARHCFVMILDGLSQSLALCCHFNKLNLMLQWIKTYFLFQVFKWINFCLRCFLRAISCKCNYFIGQHMVNVLTYINLKYKLFSKFYLFAHSLIFI